MENIETNINKYTFQVHGEIEDMTCYKYVLARPKSNHIDLILHTRGSHLFERPNQYDGLDSRAFSTLHSQNLFRREHLIIFLLPRLTCRTFNDCAYNMHYYSSGKIDYSRGPGGPNGVLADGRELLVSPGQHTEINVAKGLILGGGELLFSEFLHCGHTAFNKPECETYGPAHTEPVRRCLATLGFRTESVGWPHHDHPMDLENFLTSRGMKFKNE